MYAVTKASRNRFSREQWLLKKIGKEGINRIASGLPLEKPIQIEIHPYSIHQKRPCSNNCVWCTRKYDRDKLIVEKARGINPQNLIDFIKSFSGYGIHEFALAGNSTEPLLYPRIEDVIGAIKDIGSAVRLYTNFQYGKSILKLVPRLQETDLIRISLDAGSSEIYQKTHNPYDGLSAFERVTQNIEDLLSKRSRSGGNFSVIITYLVNKLNCGEAEIAWLMDWAAKKGVDAVRFIRPLAPSNSDQKYYPLSQDDTRKVYNVFRKLSNSLAHSSTEFVFSDADDVEDSKPFKECHYWKFAAVLGSRGMFFPCTSTAVAEYVGLLGRADIHGPDFDFWRFWHDESKWLNIDVKNRCPECTRAENKTNFQIEQQKFPDH